MLLSRFLRLRSEGAEFTECYTNYAPTTSELATVGDAVVFLRSLLPGKPVDEIYTVLGRAKQGKTERYRAFFSHLQQHPSEQLVHAEGTPGMVMAVFTLPSYPLVFKVIRDRFGWQKAMTRQDVQLASWFTFTPILCIS